MAVGISWANGAPAVRNSRVPHHVRESMTCAGNGMSFQGLSPIGEESQLERTQGFGTKGSAQ